MPPERIEFCVNNVDIETRSALLDADVETDQQHCLQLCGLCHSESFLVADGTFVTGADYDELVVSAHSGSNCQEEKS